MFDEINSVLTAVGKSAKVKAASTNNAHSDSGQNKPKGNNGKRTPNIRLSSQMALQTESQIVLQLPRVGPHETQVPSAKDVAPQ